VNLSGTDSKVKPVINTPSFLSAKGANTHLRGTIQSTEVRELSGMAPVVGASDKYWAINDSGNRPRLFALNGDGSEIASIDLPIRNRDWEDLSAYTFQGENWIAIADTGDNLEIQKVSSIYIFRQPDINNPPKQLTLFKQIDFTYPDQSRNVESMAVSPAESRIYLIAKDRSDQSIYTLPLDAAPPSQTRSSQNTGRLVAKRVGQLAKLRPTVEDAWWERTFATRILLEATAADISADNRTAVVANYRHVYLFKRHEGESWGAAFARRPEVLTTHRMQQSESVAFSANGAEVIVSSEGVCAAELLLPCRLRAQNLLKTFTFSCVLAIIRPLILYETTPCQKLPLLIQTVPATK